MTRQAGWQAAAGGSSSVTLIDFESITGSTTVLIVGDEFSNFAGQPSFALAPQSESADLFVGNPSTRTAQGGPRAYVPGCR